MSSLARPLYHFLLAYLGAFIYGFPSRKLIVIGVTGTNGKTTVVHLVHHIFNYSGIKTGSVSSLQFCIGNKCEKNLMKMTMPGRFGLQRFLRKCVKNGVTHAIIEVTSQGVLQHRHRGIKFDYAVLTNVTPEHIEAHGGFENYRASKLRFFEYVANQQKLRPEIKIQNRQTTSDRELFDDLVTRARIGSVAVVNAGDHSADLFLAYPFNKKIKYRGADLNYFNPLLGDFNKANVMAAVKVAELEGLSREQIEQALKTFPGVPGRLEFIQREPFAVVVDYAHTPDALRKVYQVLRGEQSMANSQQLICVLGAAGGGRDKWKRPEIGEISAEFCGEVILTNEDPYDENPASILEEIEAGFSQIRNLKSEIRNFRKIIDRQEAIHEALKSAEAGDTVIITGKGAEPWIIGLGGLKISWDDREVVREELRKIR